MTRTLVNSVQPFAKNAFINSNFDFWQRGTSFTNPSVTSYGPDRWAFGGSGTGVVFSRQAFGQQIEVPNSPKYYLRCVATSLTSARDIRQPIENVGTFAGKTVVMSFWARCTSGTYTATNGVGIIQNFGTGGSPSGQVAPTGQTITLTPNWTRYSFTIAVPSIVGKTLGTNNNDYIAFYINTPGSGTFTAEFAQFMINEGNQALDWNLAGTNLQGELAMCQRYYEKSFDIDTPPGVAASGVYWNGNSNSGQLIPIFYRVTKRAVPAGGSGFRTYAANTGTIDSVRDNSAANDKAVSYAGNGANGTTNGYNVLVPTGVTGNYILFHWTADAEL